MNCNKLFIIGSGEFAELAYQYFTHDSIYDVEAFCVHKSYITGPKKCGLPVVPYEEVKDAFPLDSYLAFTGIPASNMNQSRSFFYRELKGFGYSFASYISSSAFKWINSKVGENSFVFENNTLQPFTQIGNNCILWSGNHIGHRTIIEDDCFISSHVVISGYCTIGRGSYIGVNATILDNVKVANSTLIGAGAVVAKDTIAEQIYIGNPARPVPGKSSFDSDI
jgi:sugar O-acyltransferase (sialic acid O-acetyltransferase NeuD family)